MAKQNPFDIHMTAGSAVDELPEGTEIDDSFDIAVIGAFRGHRGEPAPLASRTRHTVDRDDLDDVLARVAPRVNLNIAGKAVAISFSDLDSFHPDMLWERLPLLAELRESRKRASEARAPAHAVTATRAASVLDEILGEAQEEARSPLEGGDLQDFLNRVVGPHLVPGQSAQQLAAIEKIDTAIHAVVREILHDPAFQAVESAWRAVYLLTRRLETDAALKVHLIDASMEEMAADAAGVEAMIGRGAPGGRRWSVIVVLHEFGAGNLELLEALGRAGVKAGAPVVAQASPELAVPEEEEAARFGEFRKSVEARALALCLPRYLARLPYGEDADSCDVLRGFEEMPARPAHQHFCWASSSALVGLALGQSFSQAGPKFRPGLIRDVDHLPLYTYQEDGETVSKPCAEVLLTDEAIEAVVDQGLIPIAWRRDSDLVRIVRFQSIADPPAALAGSWS